VWSIGADKNFSLGAHVSYEEEKNFLRELLKIFKRIRTKMHEPII
jgi:lactam utilization protein B